jgi:hypothetical protein
MILIMMLFWVLRLCNTEGGDSMFLRILDIYLKIYTMITSDLTQDYFNQCLSNV